MSHLVAEFKLEQVSSLPLLCISIKVVLLKLFVYLTARI